jgi:hypothetical protein
MSTPTVPRFVRLERMHCPAAGGGWGNGEGKVGYKVYFYMEFQSRSNA